MSHILHIIVRHNIQEHKKLIKQVDLTTFYTSHSDPCTYCIAQIMHISHQSIHTSGKRTQILSSCFLTAAMCYVWIIMIISHENTIIQSICTKLQHKLTVTTMTHDEKIHTTVTTLIVWHNIKSCCFKLASQVFDIDWPLAGLLAAMAQHHLSVELQLLQQHPALSKPCTMQLWLLSMNITTEQPTLALYYILV